MLSEDLLSYLNCSISDETNQHTVNEPEPLSCGHHICKKCIPKEDHDKIVCRICNNANKRDLNQHQEVPIVNCLISKNIDYLLNNVKNKLEEFVKRLKETITDENQSIIAKIEYAKETIQLRIESLNIELHQIESTLCKELDERKEEWLKSNMNDKGFETKLANYDADINALNRIIEEKKDLTQTNLYLYENRLNEIKDEIKKLKNKQYEIGVDISKQSIQKCLVGEVFELINGNKRIGVEKIIQRLKGGKYESKRIEKGPYGLCALPNGHVILSTFISQGILVYNENLELVKTIKKINGEDFHPVGIDISEVNDVFISDYRNNRIIKTNSDLEKFSTFGNGQLNKPIGISYYNGCLYICDLGNQRVQVYNSNMEFQDQHKLDYPPWYIKVSNNLACIRSSNSKGSIFFHNLSDFSIKTKYEHNGIIGLIDSSFIEYYDKSKTFYCYNRDGDLVEEIKLNNTLANETNSDGSIIKYKSNLLLGFQSMDSLFCF